MTIILSFFIVVTVACILGGAHLIVKSRVNNGLMGALVSISAGILLSLTFIEFLPKTIRMGNAQSAFYILLGIICFIFTDKYITPRLKFFNSDPSCSKTGCKTHDPKQLLTSQTACSSIACLVVCAFFDGIELSAGLKMGNTTGAFMMAALFMHLAPTGALAASISLAGQLGTKNAFRSSQILALALVLGLGVSFIIEKTTGFYLYLLPLTTGILLYNLMVHLLPAALKLRWGLAIMIFAAAITSLALGFH